MLADMFDGRRSIIRDACDLRQLMSCGDDPQLYQFVLLDKVTTPEDATKDATEENKEKK